MIELIYSPRWFFGKDILIDVISIIVLSLISWSAVRFYRINRKKNYMWFSMSFLMLALAFVFKIISNFTLHYTKEIARNLGFVVIVYKTFHYSFLPYYAGYLLYRLFMLFGLYMLYSIYSKQRKEEIFLISYFLIISTYFGISAYYLFHVTALILLSLITYAYFTNYMKSGKITNRLLYYSFLIITLSQVVFAFIALNNVIYAVAEVLQLLGYGLLLITFIMVLKHGKKKRQN